MVWIMLIVGKNIQCGCNIRTRIIEESIIFDYKRKREHKTLWNIQISKNTKKAAPGLDYNTKYEINFCNVVLFQYSKKG